MSDLTNTFYASEGWHGYGTQLLIGCNDGSPETFQAAAFIWSLTPGSMDTAVLERTHLRSPGAHREKLLGMRDSGPFAGLGRWVPTTDSQRNQAGSTVTPLAPGLIYLWRNRLEWNFGILLTDGSPGTLWSFRGGVTKFQPGQIGDAVCDFSFEVTPLQDSTALLP